MIEKIAPDLAIQRHPLSLVGCQMGRVVSLIRLVSGKLVIHSTAPFTKADVVEIGALGEPAWVMEATCFHDTFAAAGREAFPDLPYLVPPGFPLAEKLETGDLSKPPEEWRDELEVIEIGGMPKVREHAVFHRPSKTLIVADLMFNLPPDVGRWTQLFLRATAGISKYPGMSRLFRFLIKDRAAFVSSIQRLAALDFERIVVAHGDPIEDDAKAKFVGLMKKFGFVSD